MSADALTYRTYLIHLTHYDPVWYANKDRERPFDLAVARRLVDHLSEVGFSHLMIDIEDGARFASHPEFGRHYTVPMDTLQALADHAHERGLDVIPKLNFARSAINAHNHWMRAPGETWYDHFDDDYWWTTAAELIDECRAACRPQSFFHIGMDEDHDRSYTQHSAVITRFHALLAERGLRTVIWNDSAITYDSGHIYVEKGLFAEDHAPSTVVHTLWNYRAVPTVPIERISGKGLELWGAPGATPELVRGFRDALLAAGGTGLVMTRWISCIPEHEQALSELITSLGPLYAGA